MRQVQEAYRLRQVIDPAAVRAGVVAGDLIIGELQAEFVLSLVVDSATIFRAVSPDGSAGQHRRIFAAEVEAAARAGAIAENLTVLDGSGIYVGDSAASATSPIVVDQVAGERPDTFLSRLEDGAARSRRRVP